jgi:hypothetical protein
VAPAASLLAGRGWPADVAGALVASVGAGMTQPLAIDLFCGLGGWTEGLLAEGYFVVGFDVERHEYGDAKYPGQLVLQDVLTIDGAQFRDAALIVASPPCQAYSYRAMPWKRAKALPPPDNSLFDACFRIQREASEAAGHHVPLIVENVKGAQPWVGRSRWNYGSFHLWGDVPALMPPARGVMKNAGGSWFAVSHNKVPHSRGDAVGDDGVKQPGLPGQEWFDKGSAAFGSKSPQRKRAAAEIAKIPLPLARHIARVFHPDTA